MKDKIDETIDTYNNIVEEYVDYFNSTDLHGNVQFQKEIDVLVKNLENGSKILDVGTAIGDYPKYLTEKCNKDFKVIGVDSSENMIKKAKENAVKATFEVMDMRKLNFSDNSFNAIICLGTLIHVDDNTALNILDKFDSMLKDDGLIIINVMEHLDGDKELYVKEPLNPKYNTYFNRYTKEFFIDWFYNREYKILQIFDNPVINASDIKAPNLTKNRFSIIVKKDRL